MTPQDLLHTIINDYFVFTDGTSDPDKAGIHEFVSFMNSKYDVSNIEVRPLRDADTQQEILVMDNEDEDKRDVLLLLIYLYKYARNYIKKALAKSEFHTADEFAFAISILMTPELTKTALFQRNIVEKTSGTEILKRLVKKGIVREYRTERNKKNIYLQLTPKGKEEIAQTLPRMQQVTEIVSGDLHSFEVRALLKTLSKLEMLHHEIYNAQRESDLPDILKRIKNHD